MSTILIVDDDREIIRLLKAYLEKANFEVFSANNGGVALHTLRREQIDLLILDLMLPDRDGWDITRLIRSDPKLCDLPIIMLTARVEDNEKIIGLEIGADDYITKPFNPREVVTRVRALLRRTQRESAPAPGSILKLGPVLLDRTRREVFVDQAAVELTPSEFELLLIFMQHPGYAFTRDELLEKALGYTHEGMGRTLDSHIKNLRRKIEPDPKNPVYIQTIYGVGYRADTPTS